MRKFTCGYNLDIILESIQDFILEFIVYKIPPHCVYLSHFVDNQNCKKFKDEELFLLCELLA